MTPYSSTYRNLLASLLLVIAVGLAARMDTAAQNNDPLTNAAVIKLVKAGFKEKTVIAIIQSRSNRFQMDTEQLIVLKRNGVSENIILAMLSTDGSVSSDEDWANDSFFKKKSTESPSDSGSGTDIFGSSGGSRSQSKQRGAQGTNQNEGTVTGSATVRILRPPSEAGGSPAKLERTPTLDNDAVVRLVEAGFSEGTIIKRIENSPADFDLSPSKLEDLHKRRVTDSVIAAMTAAMNESKPATSAPEREN